MTGKPSAKFEEIPPEILRPIAKDSVRMPRLYFYPIRFVRKFWEFYLSYIFRGKELQFEFEVLKATAS